MRHLIIRLIINFIALFVVINLPLGITFSGDSIWLLVVVAFIFGLVNAIVRPIAVAVGCLLNTLTLGLFTFVINAAMLWLTAYLSQIVGPQLHFSFVVRDFVAALLGAIVISVVSSVLSVFIRERRGR